MMGIALGGLGVLSLRLPHAVHLRHLVDLPTLLLAAFVVFILAIVAYFANPSEASFRAFLTELVFRQHLSRLSEAQECDPDDDDDDDDPRVARPIDYKGPRKKLSPIHRTPQPNDSPVVFHFANKASVSLRTPGYRLRSFLVLTFAVVYPTELALAGVQPPRGPPSPSPRQRGAWFIGAFGRWWLALEMCMSPRPVRLAAHDNDVVSPAVVSAVPDTPPAPRHTDDHHHRVARSRAPARTKAALRERLFLNTSPSPPRDTTPPPLPKSALLPLHGPPPAPPLLPHPTSAPTPTPTPVLAEILAQIDAARASIADLHTQLAIPVPAHATLHAAVAAARETKKCDDANRASVKARTKALDDARRHAEAGKREADKKLKAAAAERDGTVRRIERLERDIQETRARMAEDTRQIENSAHESAKERIKLERELDARRAEVGAAEEAVGTLAARARDLEGAVGAQAARLEALKTQHAHAPREKSSPRGSTRAWPPPLPPVSPRPQPSVRAVLEPSPFSTFSDTTASPTTSPCSISPSGLLPSSLVQFIDSPREVFSGPLRRPQHLSGAPSPVDAPFSGMRDETLRWITHAQPHSLPQPHAQQSANASANKGLNPTAKVFTLTPRAAHGRPGYGDAPASSLFLSDSCAPPFSDTAPASPEPAPGFFAALHSAFAPSPAEREALQRSSPLPPNRTAIFNPWPAKE